jgi:hypothetical protein
MRSTDLEDKNILKEKEKPDKTKSGERITGEGDKCRVVVFFDRAARKVVAGHVDTP